MKLGELYSLTYYSLHGVALGDFRTKVQGQESRDRNFNENKDLVFTIISMVILTGEVPSINNLQPLLNYFKEMEQQSQSKPTFSPEYDIFFRWCLPHWKNKDFAYNMLMLEVYMRMALFYRADNNQTQAMLCYERIHNIGESFSQHHLWKVEHERLWISALEEQASCYYSQKNWEQALDIYKTALFKVRDISSYAKYTVMDAYNEISLDIKILKIHLVLKIDETITLSKMSELLRKAIEVKISFCQEFSGKIADSKIRILERALARKIKWLGEEIAQKERNDDIICYELKPENYNDTMTMPFFDTIDANFEKLNELTLDPVTEEDFECFENNPKTPPRGNSLYTMKDYCSRVTLNISPSSKRSVEELNDSEQEQPLCKKQQTGI